MNWFTRFIRSLGSDTASNPHKRPVGWSSMAALLEDLESLGQEHEELYDTDVREQLWACVEAGLIKQLPGFRAPAEFGMFTPEANAKLARIMEENLERLRTVFDAFKLNTEAKRLASFQNPNLHTESGKTVNEFFGAP